MTRNTCEKKLPVNIFGRGLSWSWLWFFLCSSFISPLSFTAFCDYISFTVMFHRWDRLPLWGQFVRAASELRMRFRASKLGKALRYFFCVEVFLCLLHKGFICDVCCVIVIPLLSFFGASRKAMPLNCGMSWVSSLEMFLEKEMFRVSIFKTS